MAGLADYFADWKPAPDFTEDVIGEAPAAALAAVLDVPRTAPAEGEPLPPLWHWLYFLEAPAQRELGADGHPAHGRFLPPIPDRTRMFAGGRLRVEHPLLVGRSAERRSELADVAIKQGRSGELAFVTVRHEVRQLDRTCLVEEQDLVYRSGRATRPERTASAPAAAQASLSGDRQLTLTPDPVLLFRFSALTGNAHRIHYDEPYARHVEGYPGLVVHGPLLAVAMLETVRRHHSGRRVAALSYRLRAPVFAGEQVRCDAELTGADGDSAVLSTRVADTLAASAVVELR
ncbi:MaoC family dehydratase N-terminal domain-containing protein [Streptomyces sp. NPDC056660]|uniref:FAS1-like dehydratase domain-containing protein n=1 Tax=Streptomyces sp. NPDC056660 TaxID=3345897 RepID=UPI00369A7A3A